MDERSDGPEKRKHCALRGDFKVRPCANLLSAVSVPATRRLWAPLPPPSAALKSQTWTRLTCAGRTSSASTDTRAIWVQVPYRGALKLLESGFPLCNGPENSARGQYGTTAETFSQWKYLLGTRNTDQVSEVGLTFFRGKRLTFRLNVLTRSFTDHHE